MCRIGGRLVIRGSDLWNREGHRENLLSLEFLRDNACYLVVSYAKISLNNNDCSASDSVKQPRRVTELWA